MGALSLYLLYWHFGAYLVYADLQKRIDQLASTADTIATAYALEIASSGAGAPVSLSGPPPHTANFLARWPRESLPGLQIEVGAGQELLARATDRRRLRFEGLVEDRGVLELRAVIGRRVNAQELIVSAEVPVTPEFVATIEPELGPIEMVTTSPAQQARPPTFFYLRRGRALLPMRQVQGAGRTLAPPAHWFDYSVSGFVRLDAVNMTDDLEPERRRAGHLAIHGADFPAQCTPRGAGRRMGRDSGDGVARGRRDFLLYRACRPGRQHFPHALDHALGKRPLPGHALRRIRRFRPPHRNPAPRSTWRSGPILQLHDRVGGHVD